MYQVSGSRAERNPFPARLRELTGKMPNAAVTKGGDRNVKARAGSPGTRSAYSANSRRQAITRAERERVAALRDADIATSTVIVADGFTGPDPTSRARSRLVVTAGRAGEYAAMAGPARAGTEGLPRFLPRPGRIPGQIAGVAGVRIDGVRAERNFVY